MRCHSIATLIASALSALTVGLAQATSPPSHEALLRGLIESAARGQIDEHAFTPELLAAVRPQTAITQADLTAEGELKSVAFERAGQDGSEIYLTTFEHGALEWAFALAADGRIANARYRKPAAKP